MANVKEGKQTKVKPVKLGKRRSVVTMPCGSTVTITGKPIDGKPGVIIEMPEDATILHHNLTPGDKKA